MDEELLSIILQNMIEKRETELKKEIKKIVEFIENLIMMNICGYMDWPKNKEYKEIIEKMYKTNELNNARNIIDELKFEIERLTFVKNKEDEFNSLYKSISSTLNNNSINIT